MASSAARVDLDGNPIKAMTICVIGAGGFIGSHLCEKLMNETPHKVLAVDVYNDKIKHLLEPDSLPWAGRIHFHRINIENDSRLEGLIKMADLTINLAAICTPADYNTRPLDTIYSNFIDALPVVKYCSENSKRLIHFSTCEVYGKTIGSYLPKDSPLRQDPAYYVLSENDSPCIFGSIEKQRWSYACEKQLIERLIYGNPIKAMTICMIGAGGFIGSHLCEKLMNETPHKILAVDVYNDKIKHLLEPDSLPWAGRIHFHRINIKNDSRLEGLIKMADLTINLAAICTPADYNTRPLDTIHSNFIDTLPVVKYCSENSKHLIHFSTCEVYGKTIGSYLPKDSPLRQDSSAQILIPSAREPMLFNVAKLLSADYLARLRRFILDPLWAAGVGIFLYGADLYDRVFPITTREDVTIMQDNIAQCKKLLEENNKQNAFRNEYIRKACDKALATTFETEYKDKVEVEEAARVTEQPAAQTKVEKKTRFEAEDLTLSFYRVLSPEF